MTDATYPDRDSRLVLAPSCSRCPSLVASREHIAWGNGPTDADILVVGEAPGAGTPGESTWKGGNWTGLAYTARHSGRIVRSLFADIGFGPDAVFFTNAVKCFPSDADGSNREPTRNERETCFSHLQSELERIDPIVVVTTGRLPTETILAHEGIEVDRFTDIVLEPHACPHLDVHLLPVFHPAYQHVWIARTGTDYQTYTTKLADRLTSLLEPPEPQVKREMLREE